MLVNQNGCEVIEYTISAYMRNIYTIQYYAYYTIPYYVYHKCILYI